MAIQAIFFITAYGVGLVVGFLFSPVFALYAYVLTFFVHPQSRWWGPALPDLRWSFIAAAVAALSMLLHRSEPDRFIGSRYRIYWLCVLYVLWMWCQFGWAVDLDLHREGVIFMTKYLVLTGLLVGLLSNWRRLETFLSLYLAANLYLGWMAWSMSTGGRLDGIGGPGIDDSSSLGMVLAGAAIIAGVGFNNSHGWRKAFAALSLAFTLNGVFLTASRGAVLALFGGGIALFWLRPPRQLTRMAIYAGMALAACGILAGDMVVERMRTLKVITEDVNALEKSAFSRIEIAKAQLRIAGDHPLGAGHKGTEALSFIYIEKEWHSRGGGRSSHNTFLSVLVDQGLPGVIMWIATVCFALSMLRANRRLLSGPGDTDYAWLNAGVGGAFVAVLVAGMFSPQLRSEIFFWFLGLIMALNRCALSLSETRAMSDSSETV